jgi:hypothetical protein
VGGVYDLEGFLAHFLCGSKLADAALEALDPELNTDDHLRLEYRFARTVGDRHFVDPHDLLRAWRALSTERLAVRGAVDWRRVDRLRARPFLARDVPVPDSLLPPDAADALAAMRAFQAGAYVTAADVLAKLPAPPPGDLFARLYRAAVTIFANRSSPDLVQELQALADGGLGSEVAWLRTAAAVNRPAELVERARKACAAARTDPMLSPMLVERVLYVLEARVSDREICRELALFLKDPFVVQMQESQRLGVAISLAIRGGNDGLAARLLETLEPNPRWTKKALELRSDVYRRASHPLADRAEADVREFMDHEVETFLDVQAR